MWGRSVSYLCGLFYREVGFVVVVVVEIVVVEVVLFVGYGFFYIKIVVY